MEMMRQALAERRKRREAKKLPGFRTTRQQARDWKKQVASNSKKEESAKTIREAEIADDMRRMAHDPRYCGQCGAFKGHRQAPCPNCDN